MLAPGRSLAFVTLPQGMDPDDLVRQRGARAFEALLDEAEPLVTRLWKNELPAETLVTPKQLAGPANPPTDRPYTIAVPTVLNYYLQLSVSRFPPHSTLPPPLSC